MDFSLEFRSKCIMRITPQSQATAPLERGAHELNIQDVHPAQLDKPSVQDDSVMVNGFFATLRMTV